MYKCHGHMLVFLLGKYLGVEWLGHLVDIQHFKKLLIVFQRDYTILHSHQLFIRILVAMHPFQCV